MPYKKLAHQCLLSIIVGGGYRNQGIGTILMNNLMHLAKEYFRMEVLYLEVYQDNPAVSLYKRFGFKEVGLQRYFMKENGEYISKLIMDKIVPPVFCFCGSRPGNRLCKVKFWTVKSNHNFNKGRTAIACKSYGRGGCPYFCKSTYLYPNVYYSSFV